MVGRLEKADGITVDQRPLASGADWAGVRLKVLTRRVDKDQSTVQPIRSDARNDIVPEVSTPARGSGKLCVPDPLIVRPSSRLNKLLRRS